MGWDGGGAFSRTKDWTNDRDANVKILASRHDENDDELTTGIAACLTKNNETKPTADFRANVDATYSLGSTALRWVNAWLSGVVKFKQTIFAGTLQQATLTADRTHTLPDTSGTLVSSGVSGVAADITNDYLFFRDESDSQLPHLVNITTLANQIAALAAFAEPAASTTVAGLIETATNAETAAGASNSVAVTPASFYGGFAGDATAWQYVLPGGFYIQGGTITYTDAGGGEAFSFYGAFPIAVWGIATGYTSANANHEGPRITTINASGGNVVVNPGSGGNATVWYLAWGK